MRQFTEESEDSTDGETEQGDRTSTLLRDVLLGTGLASSCCCVTGAEKCATQFVSASDISGSGACGKTGKTAYS
jgi:hypothetical protein